MEKVLKIPIMLTPDELAKETHFPVARIRELAKAKKIVHVPCGKKILINLEKFIEFLNTYQGEEIEQKTIKGITAIKG